MPLSNYAKQKVVEWLIAKSSLSNANFYAALNTEVSSADKAGSEIAATWYKRVILNTYSGGGETDRKMSDVTVVDNVAVSSNKAPVMFYKNTGTENVEVYSITFWSTATGTANSSYMGYCNLATPLVIKPDEIANFDVGELKLTLSDVEETPVA